MQVEWVAFDRDEIEVASSINNKYDDIPRDCIAHFQLILPNGERIGVYPFPEQHCRNLVYRRRTAISTSGKKEIVIIAGYPNPDNKKVLVLDESYKEHFLELGSPNFHDVEYTAEERKCLTAT